MVNPTVYFDITADDEPLGRVCFEVGWAMVLQGGVLGGGGEAPSVAGRPSGGASAGGGAIS